MERDETSEVPIDKASQPQWLLDLWERMPDSLRWYSMWWDEHYDDFDEIIAENRDEDEEQ